MTDHNLDDLIIDNIEPKSSKTKSFLTIIALLIVVLIVAIILTKILLKNQNEQELSFKEDTTELIAPELKLQEKPKVKKETQTSLELSSMIDEKQNIPAPKPTATETTADQKPIAKKPEVIKEEIAKRSPEEEKKPEPVIEKKVEITQEYAQVPSSPKVPEIPKKVPSETSKPETVKKTVTVKKPTHLPTVQTPTHTQYYVQVGSFTAEPSKHFLSVIQSSGFNYKISKASTNGTKKLLIGPYPTRKDVDIALTRVRDRINKSAFVVQK